MPTIGEALIELTVRWLNIKWGSVSPCSGKTWAECMTVVDGCKVLWFNTADGTTRAHYV